MTHLLQVTLTVPEAKRLIARAIARLPEVEAARAGGRILLKGGTTVSAVAEELAGVKLHISGRVSPRGTRAAATPGASPHSLLLENGVPSPVDDRLAEAVCALGSRDVVITGANLIDAQGNAAMMAGAELGGPPGQVMAGLMAQGATVIIAAGLEKLGPVPVSVAVQAAGRTRPGRSLGMAVGLMPLAGRLITEVEALGILGASAVTVVGRGGLDGAEGATTLVIAAGSAQQAGQVWQEVLAVKGAGHSGAQDWLAECEGRQPGCRGHRGCVYRKGGQA
ncbi:MAG: hypothetical protein AB1445_04210 [Bacillota bacterium]